MPQTAVRPRTLLEAVDEAARYDHGTPERFYWNGVVVAWLAEAGHFTDTLRDLMLSDWLAQPVPMEQAVQLASLRGLLKPGSRAANPVRLPRMLNVCGAVWGWKEATAHRADADECASCDRRILTASDEDFVTCRNHGVIHTECAPTFCDRTCDTWPDDF